MSIYKEFDIQQLQKKDFWCFQRKNVSWCSYLKTYKMVADKILTDKYEEYDRNDQEIGEEVDDCIVGTAFLCYLF